MTTVISASSSDLTHTLSSGGTYVVSLPKNEVVEGELSLVAAPSSARPTVWIVGGRINNYTYGSQHKCLNLNNVDAYLEGLHLDKGNQAGDALAFFGSATIGGTLYVQNCLMEGVNYDSSGNHGDGIQLQSQVEGFNVDLCTVKTWRQGILWNSSSANQFRSGGTILNGANIRRTNIRVYDTTLNTHVGSAVTTHNPWNLIDDDSYTLSSVALTDCWVYDEEASAKPLVELIRPWTANATQVATAPTFNSSFVTFPAAAKISGGIRYGVPPAGDFVSGVGLNYVSPFNFEITALSRPSVIWADALSATTSGIWSASDPIRDGFWDDPAGNPASATATASTTATTNTLGAGLNAVLLAANANTLTLTFNAVIPNTYSAVASLDAAIAKTFTKTLGLDAYMLNVSAVTTLTSLDAVLSGIATVTSATVSLNAELLKAYTTTFSLDGLLNKTVTSKTVNLDARLVAVSTFSNTANLDAVIQAAGGLQVNFNAVLAATIPTTGADAVLQTEQTSGTRYTVTTSLDGVLQDTSPLTLGGDAVLA